MSFDDGVLAFPGWVNLSFETAGMTVGSALGWEPVTVQAAEDAASFSDGTTVESFEAWWDTQVHDTAFTEDMLEAAAVGPESFEVGWQTNDTYSSELGGTEVAAFGSETQTMESFELGWGNAGHEFAFVEGILHPADVNPETFEAGWRNDDYAAAFAAGDDGLGAAQFSEGTTHGAVVTVDHEHFRSFLVGGDNIDGVLGLARSILILDTIEDQAYTIIVNGLEYSMVAPNINALELAQGLTDRVNADSDSPAVAQRTTGPIGVGLFPLEGAANPIVVSHRAQSPGAMAYNEDYPNLDVWWSGNLTLYSL